jgi:ribosomal protein S18 acetylase RimI-like enzyme
MPKLEIRPFSDEHLDDAARLLSGRHQRHRAAEPLLPERFEDPAAALAELEAAWRQDETSGCFGIRNGAAVGYLIGEPRDTEVWGPNIWVSYAGHAVNDAEDVRDLYAFAAERWFGDGRVRHYVLVPASDAALIDAWFRVGFGQQQADGLREVSAGKEANADGLEIRTPTKEDIDPLIEVDLALPRHQRASPVFSSRPLPTEEESRQEWAKTLAGDDERVLIACRDGKPIGCFSLVDGERSDLGGVAWPSRLCYLGFAATLPDMRGSGAGVALMDASLAWAAESGYTSMGTDWRVTNLLASRFWPRRGFRTTFLRLYRHIP